MKLPTQTGPKVPVPSALKPPKDKHFILRSAYDQITTDWWTGELNQAGHFYQIAPNPFYNNDAIYNNLQVCHFEYDLDSVSFLKVDQSGTTGLTMLVDIIVYDFRGNQRRTITRKDIEIVGAPLDQWQGFHLVKDKSKLRIKPDEMPVVRFKIPKANTDSWQCLGSCSALGVLV